MDELYTKLKALQHEVAAHYRATGDPKARLLAYELLAVGAMGIAFDPPGLQKAVLLLAGVGGCILLAEGIYRFISGKGH
jgi:hypothetical protein